MNSGTDGGLRVRRRPGRVQEEPAMNIGHCMSKDVRIASPSQTIQTAARMMKDIDAGMLPVGVGTSWR